MSSCNAAPSLLGQNRVVLRFCLAGRKQQLAFFGFLTHSVSVFLCTPSGHFVRLDVQQRGRHDDTADNAPLGERGVALAGTPLRQKLHKADRSHDAAHKGEHEL